MSIICKEDHAIYDITVDRKDFQHTLQKNLKSYENEERYEDCIKIKKALTYLEKKKKKSGSKRV